MNCITPRFHKHHKVMQYLMYWKLLTSFWPPGNLICLPRLIYKYRPLSSLSPMKAKLEELAEMEDPGETLANICRQLAHQIDLRLIIKSCLHDSYHCNKYFSTCMPCGSIPWVGNSWTVLEKWTKHPCKHRFSALSENTCPSHGNTERKGGTKWSVRA